MNDPFEDILRSRDVTHLEPGQQVTYQRAGQDTSASATIASVDPKAPYPVVLLLNGERVHALPYEVTVIPPLETLDQVEAYLIS